MLKCSEVYALASRYEDGDLSLMQRLQVWMHVRMCDACRAFLAQLKETRRLLGKLSRSPLSTDEENELASLLRKK